MSDELQCPFVYANGKRCTGHVMGWRKYGGETFERCRKVRLYCSEKYDHAGVASGFVEKERMEFYPDKLPDEIRDAVFK